MAVRDNEPNQKQQQNWQALVSADDLARLLELRRRAEAKEIPWADIDAKLEDKLFDLYQPTHCDCCGKALPQGTRGYIRWGDKSPRAECGPCFTMTST
jgi:hypothetical protein